jgi:class 3 adenylate cyclase
VDGQSRRRRWLVFHVYADLVLVAFVVAVWVMTTADQLRYGLPTGSFWPGWIALLLSLPLLPHLLYVLARRAPSPPLPRPAPGGRRLATVLFTDIVGSTATARQVGDQGWAAMLDTHDRISRAVVARRGGRLVKQTGDGILAAFDHPGEAIACARLLRDALCERGIRIRAGVHTGELTVRGADLGGIAVHVGARVMGAAASGEVLVSRTVHDLVAGSEVGFDDRGEHALKGLDGSWPLYAVRG